MKPNAHKFCRPTDPADALQRKRDRDRRWRAANRDKVRAPHAAWYAKNKKTESVKRSGYHRRRKYGLTPEAFEEMFETQQGLCAICFTRPAKHVDHDHNTGAVRGLLCKQCNTGLGHFRDDVSLLRAAVGYLINQ